MTHIIIIITNIMVMAALRRVENINGTDRPKSSHRFRSCVCVIYPARGKKRLAMRLLIQRPYVLDNNIQIAKAC